MNCRSAQSLLAREPETALDANLRVQLEAHLESCAGCRQSRVELAALLGTWRNENARVAVPDAGHEWLELRRRIRGGVSGGARRPAASGRAGWTWLVWPLAAALLAAAFFRPTDPPGGFPSSVGGATASAELVEAPGGNASTMVFVDDKSGWLIVWATDAGG